jgi:large subunit ribosomal protein L25
MIGNNIRVSQLPVKEGVRILTSPDVVIAHVVGIREEAVAEVAAVVVAEPEVAKKGKKDEPAVPAAAPEKEKGKKK